MAQLYAEMICTGTYWAEIVRFCYETKEMFMYRIYRKPTIARMFESVIVRMREDLTVGGKTFAQAAAHQDNQTLLSECAKYAVYYNEPRTTDSRRTLIFYDEAVFARVMAALDASSGTLSPNDPNASIVIPVADPAPVQPGRRPSRKGAVGVHASVTSARAKKAASRTTATTTTTKKRAPAQKKRTKAEEKDDDDEPAPEKRQRRFESEPEMMAAWEQIQSTNKQIARAIANGDWAPIIENSVLNVQSARYKMFSDALASVDLAAPFQDDEPDNVVSNSSSS